MPKAEVLYVNAGNSPINSFNDPREMIEKIEIAAYDKKNHNKEALYALTMDTLSLLQLKVAPLTRNDMAQAYRILSYITTKKDISLDTICAIVTYASNKQLTHSDMRRSFYYSLLRRMTTLKSPYFTNLQLIAELNKIDQIKRTPSLYINYNSLPKQLLSQIAKRKDLTGQEIDELLKHDNFLINLHLVQNKNITLSTNTLECLLQNKSSSSHRLINYILQRKEIGLVPIELLAKLYSSRMPHYNKIKIGDFLEKTQTGQMVKKEFEVLNFVKLANNRKTINKTKRMVRKKIAGNILAQKSSTIA